MRRRDILRAGLRRLALLLAGVAAATALLSLAIGALTGTPLGRALPVGYYAVGSFGLAAGFFVGNRGPARGRSGSGSVLTGRRHLRWARPEEQLEAISLSAVLVLVGVVLVLIGLAVDPRVSLA